jgi:hypothetical protein
VVWVHNTNYPNAKKVIKDKKTGKERTVTISEFYPLYKRTNLPADFNRDGQHVIENAQTRLMKDHSTDIKNELKAELQKRLGNVITIK